MCPLVSHLREMHGKMTSYMYVFLALHMTCDVVLCCVVFQLREEKQHHTTSTESLQAEVDFTKQQLSAVKS